MYPQKINDQQKMYEKLTTESYLICSHVFLMIKVSPIKIMETFIFVKNKNCTNYSYAQCSKYISFSRQNSKQLQQSYLNTFSLLYDYSVPSNAIFFIRLHVHIYPTFGALFSGMIQRNLVRPEGPGAGASSLGESSSGLERALTKVRVF